MEDRYMEQNTSSTTTTSFPASRNFTDAEPGDNIELTLANAEPVKAKPTRTFGKKIDNNKENEIIEKLGEKKEEQENANKRLRAIATEIKKQRSDILESEYRIGQLLLEAKNITVKWGGWYKWLSSVGLTPDKAQALMRLVNGFPEADKIPDLFQQLQTLSKSLATLEVPADQREKFMSANHSIVKNGVSQNVPYSALSVNSIKELTRNFKSQSKNANKDSSEKIEEAVIRLNFPKKDFDVLFKDIKSEQAIIQEVIAAVNYFRKHNKGGKMTK